MPAINEDLHGNVPDKADVALLHIDLINDLEFLALARWCARASIIAAMPCQ